MPQDQIIEWAREAGFSFFDAGYGPEVLHTKEHQYSQKCFERFAALVTQHERESCALVCDRNDSMRWSGASAAIRARGTT